MFVPVPPIKNQKKHHKCNDFLKLQINIPIFSSFKMIFRNDQKPD